MKQSYTVEGMHCSSCVMNIEETVLEVPGVVDVEASLRANKVTVEHDGSVDEQAVLEAIREAGYAGVAD